MSEPKALVIRGDGINCELETAEAFRLAGFEVDVIHLNDLILRQYSQDRLTTEYQALALPGGFSFGDDLGSGRVLALKIKHGLKWNLNQYAEQGGLVIGICNGFQALIFLGVFGKHISITRNARGSFIDKWVKVMPQAGKCAWLKGLGGMDLPIRHGEGRLVVEGGATAPVFTKLERQGMMCLRYELSPNGSMFDLAGLCDSTGRIFGLMPHPEAFVRWTAHPEWTAQPNRAGSPGQGLAIFENAYLEAKQRVGAPAGA